MHILFLTHYFPPEVNAPASRTYENAKRWVCAGHQVTVITCAPNHPTGIVYPGYANRLWQWDAKDGIRILRVKSFLSANKGIKKRIINYVSFMLSAFVFCSLVRRVDIVVSTSPQFFCGIAGYLVSRLKRRPWVLEIRDLWPESIIAVGALTNRSIIRVLESVESLIYQKADHVVAVTHAFKRHIHGRGVPGSRIAVITNGADLDCYRPAARSNAFRREMGLDGKFVASYVGTHGMAHGLDVVLRAGKRLRHRDDIVFLLVGDGAERERLVDQRDQMGLDNVIMIGQQPKERMPEIIAASDACMVLLRDTALFRTVIPSKIFEAMAMERPIILGVRGESQGIVEACECGICIAPENDVELAEAVLALSGRTEHARDLGRNGRRNVARRYNRDTLADTYLQCLIDTHKPESYARNPTRPLKGKTV
jgi:glycosyltransferase involved in cell wall biosynthesis